MYICQFLFAAAMLCCAARPSACVLFACLQCFTDFCNKLIEYNFKMYAILI